MISMSGPAASRNAASCSRIAFEHVALGVQLGKAVAAREARRHGRAAVAVEQRPRSSSAPCSPARPPLARARPCRRASAPAAAPSLGAWPDAPGAAVRPVQPDAVAHRPAEQFVDRHAERPRLQVEQRVLDRADGLLDVPPAAGRRSAWRSATWASKARGSLPIRAGARRSMTGVHARAAERLVVLAPADQAVVGGDLQVVEGAPARIGVHGLDPLDLHALLFTPGWMCRVRSAGGPLQDRPCRSAGSAHRAETSPDQQSRSTGGARSQPWVAHAGRHSLESQTYRAG